MTSSNSELFITLDEVASIVGCSGTSYRNTIAKFDGHPVPFRIRPTIYRRKEIFEFLGRVDPAKAKPKPSPKTKPKPKK